MNALILAVLALLGYFIAYFTYGRFISNKVLGLRSDTPTPAHIKQDGVEYVPTHSFVLFGHHFASIAGLGPILGPAIAVIWGWLPAILWVFFGTIFMGAVHDVLSLAISLRHEGRSIGDITKDIIGKRARILFLLIIFFALSLAMGVFALVIGQLFTNFHPQAVIPTFGLILIAMIMGTAVYRWKQSLTAATLLGLVLMIGSLFLGIQYPISLYKLFIPKEIAKEIDKVANSEQKNLYIVHDFGHAKLDPKKRILPLQTILQENRVLIKEKKAPIFYQPLDTANVRHMIRYFSEKKEMKKVGLLKMAMGKALSTWIWILLIYALVASILPLWLLLQPRDYLNSFQLYAGLGLVYLGMFVGAPLVVAPAINGQSNLFTIHPITHIPPLFPFLFITVACGAISGFHCLVSSGTTVRQLAKETDAHLVAYGGMLAEGALAVVVILACTAGFPSQESWGYFYRDWGAISSLGAKLAAFIHGAGLFLENLGIPLGFGKTFVALIAVGFAMTTLDSATRLLRYNVEELGAVLHIAPMKNRYFASFLAVMAIAFFAFMKFQGKPAGLLLWGLFGTTNQLLGGIALLVGTIYLFRKKKPILYTLLPMIFILTMTLSAMSINWLAFWKKKNIPLLFVGGIIIFLTLWLCLEGGMAFRREQKGNIREM